MKAKSGLEVDIGAQVERALLLRHLAVIPKGSGPNYFMHSEHIRHDGPGRIQFVAGHRKVFENLSIPYGDIPNAGTIETHALLYSHTGDPPQFLCVVASAWYDAADIFARAVPRQDASADDPEEVPAGYLRIHQHPCSVTIRVEYAGEKMVDIILAGAQEIHENE